jgi:hypothetical protein
MSIKDKIVELLSSEDTKFSSTPAAFFHQDVPKEGFCFNDEDDEKFLTLVKKLGLTFECVAEYGGEGCGDEYWTVYKFESEGETTFVKFDGWYASYQGSEYDNWFYVEPREVLVTRYFKVS